MLWKLRNKIMPGYGAHANRRKEINRMYAHMEKALEQKKQEIKKQKEAELLDPIEQAEDEKKLIKAVMMVCMFFFSFWFTGYILTNFPLNEVFS